MPERLRLAVPVLEVGWSDEPGVVASHVRPLLWQSCAQVTLAWHGGSHGTGVESAGVRCGTVTLFVDIQRDLWRSSASAEANLAGTLAAFETVPDDDCAIVAAFERWLCSSSECLRAAWRAADTRVLRYQTLATVFADRLRGLSSDERSALARFAHFDSELCTALADPHGLAWLGSDCYERAAQSMGFDAKRYVSPPMPGRLSARQLDVFTDFAIDRRIDRRERGRLTREAERQQLAGVLRFSLASRADWDAFREDVQRLQP
jgi:hypothetical protein